MKEGQKGAIGTGVEKRLEKNQELFGKLKKKKYEEKSRTQGRRCPRAAPKEDGSQVSVMRKRMRIQNSKNTLNLTNLCYPG